MRFVEVEGKSKQDAIEKAAKELGGLPVGDVGVEMLSDGSRGFLGIGARKVKIRAWSKKESRERLHVEDEETLDAGPVEPEPEPEPEEEEEEESPSFAEKTEKAHEARQLLDDLVGWISDGAHVEVKDENKEKILLEIRGDNNGLLIGKRGQTLDALQFLVNKMVNRFGEAGKRIEVDMEQYRKRREQALRNMAFRLGEKVKRKRKPITIEAMNAHDRRIIHITLKNDRALDTKSVGKGEMRKLVIHPANSGRSRRHEGSGKSR